MNVNKWSSMLVLPVLLLGMAAAAPAAAATQQESPVQAARPGADLEPAGHGTCTSWRRLAKPEGTHIKVPSIGSTGTTHCLLRRGNRGLGVRALQIGLAECSGGFYNGVIDGIFGPQTQSALRSAQNRLNITVDGIYGPQTRSHMFWPAFNSGDQLVGICWGF
jgi:peptidoglycan hydrolase-like protein with peptidoglycan-binding domain